LCKVCQAYDGLAYFGKAEGGEVKPIFKDLNSQNNRIAKHYWDKAPTCSLVLGENQFIKFLPARNRTSGQQASLLSP
jgi:hypothetical protein